MPRTDRHDVVDATAEVERLTRELETLREQKVDDWLQQIRYGSVVPLGVERSLSWRITKPIRLVDAAITVVRHDGVERLIALLRARRARRAGRS